ncbi:MAG TPA: MMPL family transporter [Caproicibacter sp.]|nr:MMPL family transporter [Caproicibacter sp.]
MSRLLKWRWALFVLWIGLLAVSIVTMPDISELVRTKGSTTVSSTSSSMVADNILKEMDRSNHVKSAKTKNVSMVLIYYNKNTLSDTDKQNIKSKVENLKSNESRYGILTVSDLFADSNLADTYISKDKTTLMVPITLDKGTRTVDSIRSNIMADMKADGSELYSTSGDLVNEDFVQETEAGVQKTELITIIFIVAVLLLIFRSPVTPFMNLLTVGISFLVSLNITFQFVKFADFPVSNYTQIFLVLILFGIGTDYTMLLLTRFKEELAKGRDCDTAIANTYRTAGKTILFSSCTILIGFVCLYFVQFLFYRSASAVAIGIVVLDLVLFTFVPGILRLLGRNLFWSPFKSTGHADSKVWEKVSRFSTKCPYAAIAFAALACCTIFFYNNTLSYNNMKEVLPSYPSIKGYDIVSTHFSAGQAMPLTIAIENKTPLNSQSALGTIDSITEAVKGVKGVKSVYSVTQPKAGKIDDLYLGKQARTLNNGLNSAKNGIGEISSGLNSAIKQLKSATKGTGSLGQLQSGTASLSSGLETAAAASGQVSDGLKKLKSGSGSLAENLAALESASGKLGNGLSYSAEVSSQITGGIGKIKTNLAMMQMMLNGMTANYGTMKDSLNGVGTTLGDVNTNLTSAGGSLTDLGTQVGILTQQLGRNSAYTSELVSMGGDMSKMKTNLQNVGGDLLKMQTVLQGFSSSAGESAGITQAQNGLSTMLNALGQLESASSQLSSGLLGAASGSRKIAAAAAQLNAGAEQLDAGLAKASQGQEKVAAGLTQLSSGAKRIQSAQDKLISGVEKVASQATELSDGLSKAVNGLNKVSGGLSSAGDYLGGLAGSSYSGSIFYIPNDKINTGDFTTSMNNYMSSDRKITKLIVMLSIDPYSNDAMDVVKNIHGAVDASLKNSSISGATCGISGITQSNMDLNDMSNNDFSKARIIMLAGIFLILLIVTRSFWMPIFVLSSLVASYFIANSLSGLLFRTLLGRPQLSWVIPFCSFVMTIALGVDYSIFLIMRHNENKNMKATDSIVLACRKVGGVITSAALILSGTFAAMYPSGITTLMEISITVIFGLLTLCLVFLPMAIPALISLQAKIESLKYNERFMKMTEEDE